MSTKRRASLIQMALTPCPGATRHSPSIISLHYTKETHSRPSRHQKTLPKPTPRSTRTRPAHAKATPPAPNLSLVPSANSAPCDAAAKPNQTFAPAPSPPASRHRAPPPTPVLRDAAPHTAAAALSDSSAEAGTSRGARTTAPCRRTSSRGWCCRTAHAVRNIRRGGGACASRSRR